MDLVKTPLRFDEVCLYCENDMALSNYNCSCSDKQWHNEYRTLDLQLNINESDSEQIKRSFNRYSLNDNLGMLQYEALPGLSFIKSDELTVGNTPLLKLSKLGTRFGTNLFIKGEGHNPSGCFKDRETMMCLLHSRKQNLNSAVIYSSGNAAASAAVFAQHNDFHLITFVSGDTYREKIDFILERGADVIVIGNEETNFEEGYRKFCEINADKLFIDNGYDNWAVTNPYRTQGDKTIAIEMIHQLSHDNEKALEVPDFVIIPTANGSCMAGVYKGFKELRDLGIINKLPKMISVGISNANPVSQAIKKQQFKKPEVCDLSLADSADAKIGSVILAEEGYDSIQAAKAVENSNGLAMELTKKDIEQLYHLLLKEEAELMQEEDILPEPASVLAIAAAKKLTESGLIGSSHKVVAVVTGSGLKARKKIREILSDAPDSLALAEQILSRKSKKQYPKDSQKGREISVSAKIEDIINAFNQLTK